MNWARLMPDPGRIGLHAVLEDCSRGIEGLEGIENARSILVIDWLDLDCAADQKRQRPDALARHKPHIHQGRTALQQVVQEDPVPRDNELLEDAVPLRNERSHLATIWGQLDYLGT